MIYIYIYIYIYVSDLNHFVPEIVLTFSGTVTGEVSLNVKFDCRFGTVI